jgi:hypothetical protein
MVDVVLIVLENPILLSGKGIRFESHLELVRWFRWPLQACIFSLMNSAD